MTKSRQICRICLSTNVKMFELKNTNMENLYTLLTQAYFDADDGKPTTVCFLCYARLRQCDRLQQQAVKSNELLEQLLKGGIMQATAFMHHQHLQVSCTYYLSFEPGNCEDVLLHPKVEVDSLISVGEEVEGEIDKAHNMTVFSEVAIDSYDLDPNAVDPNPGDDQLIIAICTNKSVEIKDIVHATRWRKQQEKEKMCSIQQKRVIKNNSHLHHSTQIHEKDKVCKKLEEAKKVKKKSERKLRKTKINVKSNEQKNHKPSHNDDTQKKCVVSPKTHIINKIIDKFECNECGNKFSTEHILADHIIQCMKTSEIIVRGNRLKKADNTKIHHPKSLLSEWYSCDICTFETNLKRSIETHLKMHNVAKVLSCKICKYRCAYKSDLKRHMKKHTDEKPFSCSICEYRCAHKYTLKTHLRNHTGEKPFCCDICKYRSAQKGSLKTHMRNHTGEKPFSCHICRFRCAQKGSLNRHMKTHTE